jgi:M6 family metalloprotease-like protein
LRPMWLIAGVCVILAASDCLAAPPLRDSAASAWAGSAPLAGNRAPRIPRRPLGVDAPERARQTAGVKFKAVVILLQFSDQPADTLNHPPAAFANLLFSQGTHPTGSLRDYYAEVSRGAFDIEGIVTRWYTAPRTYAEYTNNQGGFGVAPNNAQQMALDALRLVDSEIDFTQFDNDGPDGVPSSGDDDGEVDALFIVHAGPGGEETENQGDIWSHKWNLPGGTAQTDEGVNVFAYTTQPERWQISTPWTTAGDLMSIGVFCHEFGHVLGLPDLYDTSGLPGASEGLGDWDLMATGLFTHRPGQPAGSSPAHLSAWSKMTLGWVEPTWVFQDSFSIAIPPVETSGTVYRLWTNGVDAGEFFLVENRQPIGFDAGLVRGSIEGVGVPAHGLILYHVDPAIIGNENAEHKMVDIEEGGGIEAEAGFAGVQNLDLERGSTGSQTVCGGSVVVRGNRGDRYDPWPGLASRTTFDANTCPSSDSYCGGTSQVAIQNITESGSTVTADFLVTGTTVERTKTVVDDSPFDGNTNNGNGLVEIGETVRIHFPLRNVGAVPTGELSARVEVTEPYVGILADSIYYGVIGGAEVDTGSVIYAVVNAAPDPRGVNFRYTVSGPAGLVLIDSVQVLLGQRTGICESFESTIRRWVAIPIGCGGVNEWHRESGVNHTPGGAWAWRLGPVGLIGHYAAAQDARLVGQPIRLAGPEDTLRFWQRYDSEFAFDGLTVEISADDGATWSVLEPIGGYNTGDRFSGLQTTFSEVTVPLTGYEGVVQIAFRFRSQPPNEGLGWWIDDVIVSGDASCATTALHVERFEGAASPAGAETPSVRLDWTLRSVEGAVLGLDRDGPGATRVRVATIPAASGDGNYVDRGVFAGGAYRYWLSISREGEPTAEAGPIQVLVPPGGPSGAPRAFAMSPVHPNPFAGDAMVTVSLDRAEPFMVRVFRADGRLVRTLARGPGAPSELPLRWDGRDDHGRPAGAGLYFIQLRSGNRTRVQKAVLLR